MIFMEYHVLGLGILISINIVYTTLVDVRYFLFGLIFEIKHTYANKTVVKAELNADKSAESHSTVDLEFYN